MATQIDTDHHNKVELPTEVRTCLSEIGAQQGMEPGGPDIRGPAWYQSVQLRCKFKFIKVSNHIN